VDSGNPKGILFDDAPTKVEKPIWEDAVAESPLSLHLRGRLDKLLENLLADFEEFSQEEFRKFREEGVKERICMDKSNCPQEEFRQLRDESMKVNHLLSRRRMSPRLLLGQVGPRQG